MKYFRYKIVRIYDRESRTNIYTIYVGYSESKSRLRISLAHTRDCHFAHVQFLIL